MQGVDDRKGKAQALDVSGGVTRSAQPNGALSMPGAPFAAGSASMAAAPGALMGTAKSWHPDKRFGFISALCATTSLHRVASATLRSCDLATLRLCTAPTSARCPATP